MVFPEEVAPLMDGVNPSVGSSIPFFQNVMPQLCHQFISAGTATSFVRVKCGQAIIDKSYIWCSDLAGEKENSSDLLKKIEQAVAELADEENNDWWIAHENSLLWSNSNASSPRYWKLAKGLEPRDSIRQISKSNETLADNLRLTATSETIYDRFKLL